MSQTLTGAELAPGGVAYRKVAEWLTNATMIRRTVEGNTWTVELRRADGSMALIAWTTQAKAQLSLPASWKAAKMEDLRGGISEVRDSEVAIGPSPLFFREGP